MRNKKMAFEHFILIFLMLSILAQFYVINVNNKKIMALETRVQTLEDQTADVFKHYDGMRQTQLFLLDEYEKGGIRYTN